MKVIITKFRSAIDVIFNHVDEINDVIKEVVLAMDGKKLCVLEVINRSDGNNETTKVDDFSFNFSKNLVTSKTSSRRVKQ